MIGSETLGGLNRDAVGLISPAAAGFDPGIWRDASPDRTEALLRGLPVSPWPAVQDLVFHLLVTEAEPPGTDGERFLRARLDALVKRGALDQALALAERAGADTPDLFDIWFDVALLSGRADRPCTALLSNPALTPSEAALAFCLARSGRWMSAWTTVETSAALGTISDQDHAVLTRFLDPELFEDDAPLTWSQGQNMTPLTFRMLEAIGVPPSTDFLPLAYAWADTGPTKGWKAQLEASERLARSGALSTNQLLGVYTLRQANLSGALWDRVRAVQALDATLTVGDSVRLPGTLSVSLEAMDSARLAPVLARLVAPRLARLDLPPEFSDQAARLEILAGEPPRPLSASASARLRLAHTLVRGDTISAEKAPEADALANAVAQAFARPSFSVTTAQGQVLLAALTLLAPDASADAQDVGSALEMIRAAGQEPSARWIAASLLLEVP
ncbi:MAG: hypothetical protein AAGF71_11280 [Pseudomonadota bacterium]